VAGQHCDRAQFVADLGGARTGYPSCNAARRFPHSPVVRSPVIWSPADWPKARGRLSAAASIFRYHAGIFHRKERYPVVADGQRRRECEPRPADTARTIRLGAGHAETGARRAGRQQRGHWNTTVANAWGVLAMKKFSARFETVPVAGTTSATLGKSAFSPSGATIRSRRNGCWAGRLPPQPSTWPTTATVNLGPRCKASPPCRSRSRYSPATGSRAKWCRSARRSRANGTRATWRGYISKSMRNPTWPGSS